MIFDVAFINLILYCAQQLGIALGLGAQTIMLVAYVAAMRDGSIDDTEERFLKATRTTLWVSLALIALSGIAITTLHVLAGQGLTVLTPAYLFKLLLIVVVIVLTALLHTLPETFAEGLLGGTWYALFVVHILAPITTWINLFTLLAVWMVGFNLVWYVIVFASREKNTTAAIKPVVKKEKEPAVSITINPASVAAPAPMPPQHFEAIKIDPVPVKEIIIVEATKPAPLVVPTPPARPVTLPVEKLPAGITTDTPFLPQVPPLQPIPTIQPEPGTAPTAPDLQKPVDTLGLNVMPKSPNDLNQQTK